MSKLVLPKQPASNSLKRKLCSQGPLKPKRTSESPAQSNRIKQCKFFGRDFQQETPFGGSLLKNSHAKVRRPFASRATMHITLKTKGYNRLLIGNRRKRIEGLVRALANRHFVMVRNFANSGNHLHLLLETRSKLSLNAFLRGLSGGIARMVLYQDKLRLQPKTGRFWLQRPWSRILSRKGNVFWIANRYVDLNRIESWGIDRISARLRLSQAPFLALDPDFSSA